MQNAETVVDILRARGRRGLPCDELYRQLFNPALFLMAWGRIYANDGAMTPGARIIFWGLPDYGWCRADRGPRAGQGFHDGAVMDFGLRQTQRLVVRLLPTRLNIYFLLTFLVFLVDGTAATDRN